MLENIPRIYELADRRTNDLSEPAALYVEIINELSAINHPAYFTRAEFINEQLNGNAAAAFFDTHRTSWGIPAFDEDILSAEDFKRGFLWCFRHHTTSWGDTQKAKTWFLTSTEALFVRRYEFWSCDNGFDECLEVREGSYKEILSSLLKEGDYDVLESPVFTTEELDTFIETYDEQKGDFTIGEILEDHIEANPNYRKNDVLTGTQSQTENKFSTYKKEKTKEHVSKKMRRQAAGREYRKISVYMILFCGIVIILSGIYLWYTHGITQEMISAGRRRPISFGPVPVIIIGACICIYPIYQLIEEKVRGRKDQ